MHLQIPISCINIQSDNQASKDRTADWMTNPPEPDSIPLYCIYMDILVDFDGGCYVQVTRLH